MAHGFSLGFTGTPIINGGITVYPVYGPCAINVYRQIYCGLGKDWRYGNLLTLPSGPLDDYTNETIDFVWSLYANVHTKIIHGNIMEYEVFWKNPLKNYEYIFKNDTQITYKLSNSYIEEHFDFLIKVFRKHEEKNTVKVFSMKYA